MLLLQSFALVSKLGFDEFAVETGDIAQRHILGALCGTCACVGAVAEAEFVHLLDHSAGTTLAFYLTLGEEGKLAHLGRNEEHCRTILAGSHASSAADAGGRVHGHVGNLLRDGGCVGVGGTTAVERHIAAGLLDFIECVAVYHKVADHGESGRAPGLDGDGVAIVEFTHMELTGGDSLYGSVGMTVDVEGAHAADTFAAVAVKHHRLLSFLHELLIEHVEHFKEAASGGDIVEVVVYETALLFGASLAPDLEVYAYCMFHF